VLSVAALDGIEHLAPARALNPAQETNPVMSNLMAARPHTSIHALRGIRFIEGEDGAQPAESETPAEPKPKPAAPKAAPAQEPDWKAEARKWEQRAKENSSAAEKLQKLEDAQKTEAQKLADKIADLEKTNAELAVAKLRVEVAKSKSDPEKGIVIPADLLTGSTQEELEASADALIKFKGEQAQQKQRLHVPAEGKQPTGEISDEHEFVRDFFGNGD
jgi:hypothetical protein